MESSRTPQGVVTLTTMLVKPNCKMETCNPLNFTILKPDRTIWTTGYPMTLQISSQETDLGVYLYIIKKKKQKQIKHSTQQCRVFESFHEHIHQELPKPFPLARNPFTQLAENIASSLHISSCYVCGGTTMGDQWPWEARELMPEDNFTLTVSSPEPLFTSLSIWLLKTSVMGKSCIVH